MTVTGEKVQLTSLAGDAGFRRYFRFNHQQHSYIAVDAPAQYCNNANFILMQQLLAAAAIPVPQIIAQQPEQGFFCLSDLGETLLSQVLTEENFDHYYKRSAALLLDIASIVPAPDALPLFDRPFIQQELAIFCDWLLVRHLNLQLAPPQMQQLQQCFELLIANALEQPQVTMHRDFHSRNLMLHQDEIYVIDFQDAVQGPATYDIVSLLRDCYLRWPDASIAPVFQHYCRQLSDKLQLPAIAPATWQRWFDLTGLQRHLKAAGIFARLHHRDGKSGYLADVPLTLSYIVDISARYPELAFIHQLVSTQVLPRLASL